MHKKDGKHMEQNEITGYKKVNKMLKPENRKHSLRTALVMMTVGIIVLALLVIGVINVYFLGSFYQSIKQRQLMSTYQFINTTDLTSADEDAGTDSESGSGDDSDQELHELLGVLEFPSSVKKLSVENNIQILVTDTDMQTLRATGRESVEEAARLFGYFTGLYRDGITIIESSDMYIIQTTEDRNISTEYLEMWGQLDSGEWFLLRTPLESISTSARISNIFYMIVGAIVAAVSVIAMWFLSKRFTKPITQLTELSQKMAEQDFEARYEGTSYREIDILGQNYNKMSQALELTISELKSANLELQKDVERKTQVDEARREFLNNVTHELKTPIALIQGYAEGLKDNVAEDVESRDFYCDVIIDESAKMDNMVRKLLSLNALEFGNDPVVFDRFDLTQLVRGVISGMKILIEEKQAEVSFPSEKAVYVWGDEFKIEEVVTNYLSNALNHLDGERKIEITIRQEEGNVRVSVFNTGTPIPDQDLDHVFEKFFKVDKARTREYGGSGIGLSIVKAIMEGHNQNYGVANYDNGVAFWFTLEGK